MADDVLWVLDADAEPTVSALEQIDAAASAMGDALSESVASMEEEISTLTESLTELSALADETSGAMGGMSDAMSSMGDTIAEDNTMISSLNEQITNLEAQLTALTGAEEEAAAGAEGLGAAEETAAGESTSFGESLSAAMGPLMMIGTLAALAGGKFVQMGMDGQKGEALLSGMAGASQQDIQALQQEALKLGVSMDQASQGFYEVESAGYSGRDAITVFDNAMKLSEGGQAQASDVMTGLTAIMHDYGLGADQAGGVTDKMAEAVLRGKQQMEDFATSIGPLASAGHNAGVGLNEVLAAESTMTQINPHVRQDTMQLAGLFQSLSPTMGHTAETAKSLGLSFNEAHFASLDLMGKLQYLAQIAGGDNTAAFIKLTGGVRGSTAAIDLLTGKGQAFKGNLDAMGHSAGATAHAFDSWESTIPAHLDKVGAAFSVLSTKLMDAIGPKVTPIIDKVTSAIGKMSDLIMNHTDQVTPILAGLAAVIGTALVMAMVSFVIAAAPVLAVLLTIGAAVAGITYLYTHWSATVQQVNVFMKQHQLVMDIIMGVIIGVATALAVAFVPAMAAAALSAVIGFGAWAIAAGAAAIATLAVIWPFLLIGAVVAVVVVGIILAIQHWGEISKWLQQAWANVIGWLGGALNSVGAFFVHIWHWIQDATHAAWNFIVNAVKIGVALLLAVILGPFIAIAALFVWLYNHNTYFKMLIDKIVSIVKAGLTWLSNAWHSAIGFIVGLFLYLKGEAEIHWEALVVTIQAKLQAVENFIHGILLAIGNFFIDRWNNLVSNTEALWNKISSIFSGAWNTYISTPLHNLWNSILGFVGGWPSQAVQWGVNLIKGLINGILSMIGGVGNAVGQIAGKIGGFLGFHSPTEEGPGAQSDQWAPAFIDMYTGGLKRGASKVGAAATGIAQALQQAMHQQLTGSVALSATTSVTPPSVGSLSNGIGGGGSTSQLASLLSQILNAIQQQQRGATSGGNVSSSVTMNNSFNGVSNFQQLYAMLNQMAGQQFESGLRGGF